MRRAKDIVCLEGRGAHFGSATVGPLASDTVVGHDTIVDCRWVPDSLVKQDQTPRIAGNADDQAGRIVQALKESGDWAGTRFVVLADLGAALAADVRDVDTAGGDDRPGTTARTKEVQRVPAALLGRAADGPAGPGHQGHGFDGRQGVRPAAALT